MKRMRRMFAVPLMICTILLLSARTASADLTAFIGVTPTPEWRTASLLKVDEAAKPYGALEFRVIPSVRKLINAAADAKSVASSN